MTSNPPTNAPAPIKRPSSPRPGWRELAVGLGVLLALEIGLARAAFAMHLSAVVLGVFMTALSAIVAGGDFPAALLLRVRKASMFGLVRTSSKWILVGIAGGIVATLVKIPATMAFTASFGQTTSSQDSWSRPAAAAS